MQLHFGEQFLAMMNILLSCVRKCCVEREVWQFVSDVFCRVIV